MKKSLNPGKKVFVNGAIKASAEAVVIDFKGGPDDVEKVRDCSLRMLDEERVFLTDGSETNLESGVFSGDVNLKVEIKKGKRNRMTAVINLSMIRD